MSKCRTENRVTCYDQNDAIRINDLFAAHLIMRVAVATQGGEVDQQHTHVLISIGDHNNDDDHWAFGADSPPFRSVVFCTDYL